MLSFAKVVRKTGCSKQEITALIEAGDFPRPVPMGPWSFAWVKSDIEIWIQEQSSEFGQ